MTPRRGSGRSKMDIVEAILLRKSVRAYKSDPVPRKLLEDILETALRAPSWANTQPWEFIILGGKKLQRIKEVLTHVWGEVRRPDIPFPVKFPEPYITRQRNLGKKLLEMQGIDRGDRKRRREWYIQMTKCFDAPNAIIISIDSSCYRMDDFINGWAPISCGFVAMTTALLAIRHGLGTCLEVAPVAYPDIIRKELRIQDSKLMVLAMAIGYPDWDASVNQFRSEREPLERMAQWYLDS